MINYSSPVSIAQNIDRGPDSIPSNKNFEKNLYYSILRRVIFFFKRQTYNIQSTANNREISLVGKPKAVSTINIVIKAALGILAAPILAKVAVKLRR